MSDDEIIAGLKRIRERLHFYDGDFGVEILDAAIARLASPSVTEQEKT